MNAVVFFYDVFGAHVLRLRQCIARCFEMTEAAVGQNVQPERCGSDLTLVTACFVQRVGKLVADACGEHPHVHFQIFIASISDSAGPHSNGSKSEMQADDASLFAKGRARLVKDAARNADYVIFDSVAQLHEPHANMRLLFCGRSTIEVVTGPIVQRGERHCDGELNGSAGPENYVKRRRAADKNSSMARALDQSPFQAENRHKLHSHRGCACRERA
jgi:hypothetical protein